MRLTLFVFVLSSLAPMATMAAATFGDDLAFLRQHTETLVLEDAAGSVRVALAPAWQGRVMTSTAGGDRGASFGWINRELIASRQLAPHINAFGGEDRLWLGPEGGQFSIFFKKGASFDFANWFVPEHFDTQPFEVVSRSRERATFRARFALTNYSGTKFDVALTREVRVLSNEEAWRDLGMTSRGLTMVAYESSNVLVNAGTTAWRKDTGLLSIWILGMFAPSPTTTIVVPFRSGTDAQLGVKVTSDYFGTIPAERLHVGEGAVFMRGDGKFRSKLGINPKRSLGKLGSYDAKAHVLTLVMFDQPSDTHDYVNSLWKLQDDPYGGDALNCYNDGPAEPGAKPLGPFFELESSSPAAALRPNDSIRHTHRTIHMTGAVSDLDVVARSVLGVSLTQIETALADR